jgi:predicted dehydrogenase
MNTAHAKRVHLAVVSQHRFDDSIIFLKRAIAAGRLGKILQADAYVKWWRSEEYYSRPIKGSWDVEGGGALINQGIHQVDMLLHLLGPVKELYGMWQLGARHKIVSEDVVQTMLRYANGAQGVIQASTAFWPGYTERLEIHGTLGTAIISGDKLTTWDVQQDDASDPAPLASNVASGASDPMAISLTPFERQFADLGRAVATNTPPSITGEDGYRALELVVRTYESCREGKVITLGAPH